jgi:CheY-like chemotaxis protein
VLIVDADEFSQENFRQALSDWGVTDIRLACNGLNAVRELDAMLQHPDVLICDILMSDMDGMAFFVELAKRNFQGGLIFVSGVNRDMRDVAQTIATDKGLYVLAEFAKPIQLHLLRKVLTCPL